MTDFAYETNAVKDRLTNFRTNNEKNRDPMNTLND